MAVRKPDAEVGPLGVWAYNTRMLLELSDVQVAERAGVVKATIRKIEGGSNKSPSRRLVFEMYRYFREVGERQDLPVEPPPGYLGELPTPEPDSLVAVLSAFSVEIQAARTERETFEERLRTVEAAVQSLLKRLADGASRGRSAPLGSKR
jgi:transcriptional regulator with XRE-family HTH domain